VSILFSDIYAKSIALFDDPKITRAYKTNEVQFDKLMYTYLQNAISMFTNPSSVGVRLSNYNEPSGVMETFDADGTKKKFDISPEIELKDNCVYSFIQDNKFVEGKIDRVQRTVEFPDVLPEGKQYAFEQYYVGEFLDNFEKLNQNTSVGNKLIVGEIKDILARLLVKSWAEEERNLLLDIRNLMQDSDFKITGNDRILKSKNAWVDQLDSEILQLQNKLSWGIRFMNSSQMIGRG